MRELSQVREDWDGESVVQDDPAGKAGASGADHEAPLPEFANSFVKPVNGAFRTNNVAEIGCAVSVHHGAPLRNSSRECSLGELQVRSPKRDASALVESKFEA